MGSVPPSHPPRHGAIGSVPERNRRLRHGSGGQGRASSGASPPRERSFADGAARKPARAAHRHATGTPAQRVWIRIFPRQSGSRLPRRDRGPGRAAGDAYWRRKIALLPVARDRARRHDAGDQPADRADGRSGVEAEGVGLRGGAHPFGPRPGLRAPGLHRLSERRAAIPVHRTRTPARSRLSRDAGQAQTQPDRHRRSPLHFAMGARFPPRLPHARAIPADAAARACDRHDGDGDSAGAGRYRRTVGLDAGGALHSRLPARQSGSGSDRGGAIAAGIAHQRAAAGRCAAAGDCLRTYAGAGHESSR